jgi:hypothetical protein
VDARPVLGVSEVRPALLVDLSDTRNRETENNPRACIVTSALLSHFASDSFFTQAAGTDSLVFLTTRFVLDDDLDEDPDEDDEFGDDEEGDDGEGEDEEDDDEDADTETWQVSSFARCR